MKKLLSSLSIIVLSALLYPAIAVPQAKKTITIAVIDTGIDADNPHLCKMGHYDFTTNRPKLGDDNGHGTHIAGIIAKEAGDGDYCLVSMKYFADTNPGNVNLKNEKRALRFAINIEVDVINFSGGGPEFDEEELLLIREALSKKIKLVFAAGNEHQNLDQDCNFYPACYSKDIVMVGNLQMTKDFDDTNGWHAYARASDREPFVPMPVIANSSNYGSRITRWEVGTNVDSTLPNGKHGLMTGTSQATAVATGKIIKERLSRY